MQCRRVGWDVVDMTSDVQYILSSYPHTARSTSSAHPHRRLRVVMPWSWQGGVRRGPPKVPTSAH